VVCWCDFVFVNTRKPGILAQTQGKELGRGAQATAPLDMHRTYFIVVLGGAI
jgi:hypothetical protein